MGKSKKTRRNKSKLANSAKIPQGDPQLISASNSSNNLLRSRDDTDGQPLSASGYVSPRPSDLQRDGSKTSPGKKKSKSVPSFMQQTGASKMGSTALLSDNPDALFYTSHELSKPKSNQLSPLSNLTRLEVANHLEAPRAQFAFLEDIKRYRVEKGRAKLKALEGMPQDPNLGRRLPSLPMDLAAGAKQQVGAGSGAGTNVFTPRKTMAEPEKIRRSKLPGPSLRGFDGKSEVGLKGRTGPGPSAYLVRPNSDVER